MIYVTTGSFKRLFLLDPAKNQPAGSLEVGPRPWGVGLLPDGRTLYTANGPSNDVSVVDLTTQQVVKKIPVGQRPWGVAVLNSPAGITLPVKGSRITASLPLVLTRPVTGSVAPATMVRVVVGS